MATSDNCQSLAFTMCILDNMMYDIIVKGWVASFHESIHLIPHIYQVIRC